MFCKRMQATMDITECVKRQGTAEINTKKTTNQYCESLLQCLNCPQGQEIKKHPKNYLNRDYHDLVKQRMNAPENKIKKKPKKHKLLTEEL